MRRADCRSEVAREQRARMLYPFSEEAISKPIDRVSSQIWFELTWFTVYVK